MNLVIVSCSCSIISLISWIVWLAITNASTRWWPLRDRPLSAATVRRWSWNWLMRWFRV
jgi:hypothetical protein